MKVLLHSPDLNKIGGVATFCSTIKDFLSCDVDLFIFGARGKSRFAIFTVLQMLMDYISYFFIMMIGRHDVVQMNPSLRERALLRDGIFVLIAKFFKKKIIVFMHGWDLNCENKVRERWLWLFRNSFFKADAFIVLAKEFKRSLELMGYKGPVYVGSTAIDEKLMSMSRNCKYPSRSCLSDAFNILFLTRVEKEKGIFEALETCLLLRSENYNIKMTVAGDGKALEGAREWVSVRNLKGVKFVGYVSGEEKGVTYRSAHCYLFPSYNEGMPISVLEAMAFGLPIITRSVGGLVDFFEDGNMGYMTQSRCPEVFAELIKKLINDPSECDRVSEFNQKYAVEHFNALSVTSEIEKIFYEIC